MTTWWEVARGSRDAAVALRGSPATYRSCISRRYYAAYQAVTALLIARGHSLPAGKEGWSHPGTAQMLYAELQPLGYSERERRKWQSDLEDLYRARVASDYVASIVIGEAEVIKASELSDEILDLVEKHLA